MRGIPFAVWRARVPRPAGLIFNVSVAPLPETKVAFDVLVVTVIAPELQRYGYRKRRLRWTRARGTVKTGISLRRAPHADLDEIRFTFDFELRTPDRCLTGRIGALMPEPDDVWWHIHRGVLRRRTTLAELEPELVAHEIADALTRVADAIEPLTSSAEVRAFADQHGDLVMAGLLEWG